MENMLMIAAIAAKDFAVWVCAHCETNNEGDTKVCNVCDMGRWTSCDIECEHSIRPASVCVRVDLDAVPLPPPPHMLGACVQVPLPYMWEWEIPANYKDLADVEREGALQLEMRLV